MAGTSAAVGSLLVKATTNAPGLLRLRVMVPVVAFGPAPSLTVWAMSVMPMSGMSLSATDTVVDAGWQPGAVAVIA